MEYRVLYLQGVYALRQEYEDLLNAQPSYSLRGE